eukprot:gene43271-57583_t
MGLSLLSYAVNLFIFSMGRLGLAIDKEPVLQPGLPQDLAHYADPMPQALTLTAIVIGFAMTALFLVVLLASRGMAGTDHVDGTKGTSITASITAWLMPHLILAPIALPLLTAGLMLLLREERQRTKVTLNITSTFLGLVVAVLLLVQAKEPSVQTSLG